MYHPDSAVSTVASGGFDTIVLFRIAAVPSAITKTSKQKETLNSGCRLMNGGRIDTEVVKS